MTSKPELIPVKEQDFLDEDPPLRAQNYVCLSFLSPEDVIKRKDVFMFEKFTSEISKDLSEFFDQLGEKYKEDIDKLMMIKDRYPYIFKSDSIQDEFNYFMANNSDLEKEYYEKNEYQTTIRGIKVRGVFDTLREAEIRSQVLKKIDNNFNVYVAQVGCWCPWSPNPEDIENQEYAETHLNSLMKKYKDNQGKKDIFYEERKKELQFLKTKENIDSEASETSETVNTSVAEELNAQDPWLKNKEISSSDIDSLKKALEQAEVVNEVVE